VPLDELSLLGLFARLALIERLKRVTVPTDAEAAALASETLAKRAIAEQLSGLGGNGLTARERREAKDFLDAQLKALDRNAKGAEARSAKFKELSAGVLAAPTADEPAHVTKARAELAKFEHGFSAIHKEYDRWEKGKNMLSVEELTSLKRSHGEAQRRVEISRDFVEQQLERRPAAAATLPSALAAASATSGNASAGGRGKAAAKSSRGAVRGGGPATRPLGGGYSAVGRGAGGNVSSTAPSTAALRQAEVAAQIRAEADAAAAEAAAAAAAPPRQRPPRVSLQAAMQEAEGPVLSYSCTCRAVAEHLGIKEVEARALAASCGEFAASFDHETWERIQQRSLAIEKAQREEQREKEKRKQAAALAKAMDSQGGGGGAPLPGKAAPKASSKAATPGAPKAKPKPKPDAAPKKGQLAGLSHMNRFGGLDSESSGEDGGAWTQVRR